MLEQYIIQIIQAIVIGLWAFLWCDVLTNAIFSFIPMVWYWVFQRKTVMKNTHGQMIPIVKRQAISNIGAFLAKPLFECSLCHAGWLSIIIHLANLEIFSYYGFMSVTVSMVTAFFVSQWANR